MQTSTSSRPVLRVPARPLVVASPAQAEGPAAAPEAMVAGGGASIDSVALLRGGKIVQIEHNGALYKLQSTKLGKLILTK